MEDPYKLAAENIKQSLTESVIVRFPCLRDWIKLHVENHQVSNYNYDHLTELF